MSIVEWIFEIIAGEKDNLRNTPDNSAKLFQWHSVYALLRGDLIGTSILKHTTDRTTPMSSCRGLFRGIWTAGTQSKGKPACKEETFNALLNGDCIDTRYRPR